MAQSPDNWEKLKQILADALEAEPSARAALIEAACAGDAKLLAEVRELAQAHDDSTGILDARTDAWVGIGGPDVLSLGGQKIGRYRLENLIAEGAMAAVYRARQANPDRSVALKLFRTSLPLIDARNRFRREAQALARLKHPNIAAIYEAGLHETGDNRAMPYIAMEYVDGLPLTVYATAANLDTKGRINLLIRVARAVQAAHQQTIIHRDLKPANVLVEKSGQPKVLDFGIARIASADADSFTWQTTAGVLLGTPGYMAPEQAAGENAGLDVRCDVWALGVMLYELLAGKLPVEVRGVSLTEALRRIETLDAPSLASIKPELAGDLSAIVATALERDKERRYPTAAALADDLERFLKNEPVKARPLTTIYALRKFARRNCGAIAGAAGTALLLIAAATIATIGFVKASRDRDRAVIAEKQATADRDRAVVAEQQAQREEALARASEKRTAAVKDFLEEIIGSPDPLTGRRDVTVIDMLRQNERLLDSRFNDQPLTKAALYSTIGWTYFNLSDYEPAASNARKSIELTEKTLGPEHELTLGEKYRLITILRWQYKTQEAKTLCDALLPVALKRFGREHPAIYPLLDNQAGIYADMEDNATASKLYADLIELGKRTLGPTHEEVLTAGNNYANTLMSLGKPNEAADVLRWVIDGRVQTIGASAPMVLQNRSNLSAALQFSDRTEEALVNQIDLVPRIVQVFGTDNYVTRSAKNRLGDILREAGRGDEAMAIAREVGNAPTADNDESRGLVGGARYLEMMVLMDDNQFDQALSNADAYLAQFDRQPPPDVELFWAVRAVRANCLSKLGKTAEGEALAKSIYDYTRESFPTTSPRMIPAMNTYAICMVESGKLAEAEAMLRDQLKIAVDNRMPLLQAASRRGLARTLILLKRYDEAQQQLDEAWAFAKGRLPGPTKQQVIRNYIDLFNASGDPEQVARWKKVLDDTLADAASAARALPRSPTSAPAAGGATQPAP